MCARDFFGSYPFAAASAMHSERVPNEFEDLDEIARGSSGVWRHIQRPLPSFMKLQSARLSIAGMFLKTPGANQQRYGWHSFRRLFASELKATNLKDLCALGGWRSAQVLLSTYIQPDEATQREALAQRKPIRKVAEK